jgi:hypothetical protein
MGHAIGAEVGVSFAWVWRARKGLPKMYMSARTNDAQRAPIDRP